MKIAVTGAAGFIGSALVSQLNTLGFNDLILVDQFDNPLKQPNLKDKVYDLLIDRALFPNEKLHDKPDVIFHIGARTDTTEMDKSIFETLNIAYSKMLWNYCVENQIPFIYASSAATYGDGESGFDDTDPIKNLVPMNPYGDSKQIFDLWVLEQKETPPNWHGFKFFNVFGPNEYHKGRMASVVFHAFNQINQSEKIKLFQSHKDGIAHGDQKRDFIYVKDLLSVLLFAWQEKPTNGIYNLGTGIARSFNDLAYAIFASLNKQPQIEYIPTPIDIRDTYQYYTQAAMQKLKEAGYKKEFYRLEQGVDDYVKNYLKPNLYL
jgi:ADP-L-glycero-D-manno-heptose 6-epimerase